MQGQLKEGVVEEADKEATGHEFYIPHKAVACKQCRNNEDANCVRAYYCTPLNNCLEVGPPLQNE